MKYIKSICSMSLAVGFASCGTNEKPIESSTSALTAPSLGSTLGRGFDPTKPLELKGDCLTNIDNATEFSWKDARGIRGRFTETQIKTVEDLHREISITASVAGEALWGGGNASFSKYEKFRSHEDSFTWLVNFFVEVGEKTLKGSQLRLTPQAQQLVDAGKLQDFYRMCGTEYVRSIKLGGKLTIVHEVESKHSELVKKISTSASGSFSGGSWGFSGSASYNSYFREAFFKSVLKTEMEQLGGNRLDPRELSPEKLGQYLTNYQNEMRQNNAVVIQIETAGWETLGVFDLNSFANFHRKNTIESLYKTYRSNKVLVDKISDYNYWDSNEIYDIPQGDLVELNSKLRKLNTQQSLISRLASACIDQNQCNLNGVEVLTVDFPEIDRNLSEDNFGEIYYSLPTDLSYYGSNTNYDGRFVRLYDIPTELIGDRNLSKFVLIVFKEACSSAKNFIEKEKSNLQNRNVTSVMEQINMASTSAYRLTWHDNRSSMLMAFENSGSGECAIVKAGISGTDWNNALASKSVLDRIAGTITFD